MLVSPAEQGLVQGAVASMSKVGTGTRRGMHMTREVLLLGLKAVFGASTAV